MGYCYINSGIIIIFQGAQTIVHCATNPSLSTESGNIYRDCKLYQPKKTLDPEVAVQLWNVSAKLTEISDTVELSS